MSTKNHKNTKQIFGKHLLALITLFLFIGCQTTPTSTSTALPPRKTETPSSTATPTLIYQPASVSFENSGIWQFTKPYIFEEWSELIVPDGDTFKLIDDFEVESIELSYQWYGGLNRRYR